MDKWAILRECRKQRNLQKPTQANSAGAGTDPERRAHTVGLVNSIGGGNRPKIECVRLQTVLSNGRELAL